MAVDTKTSKLISQQVPEFVRDEFQTFIRFLESYYEYLEHVGPPTNIPLDLTTYDPMGFQVGETVVQKTDDTFPDRITVQGEVYDVNISADGSEQTLVVVNSTSPTGMETKFAKSYYIEGQTSGAKSKSQTNVDFTFAGALEASKNLLSYHDIDTTLEKYIQYIRQEFAPNFPLHLTQGADNKTIIKRIWN